MPPQLKTRFAGQTFPLLCLAEVFVDNQASLELWEEVKPRRVVGDGFVGKIKWWVGRFVLINCKATEKRNIEPIQNYLVTKNIPLNHIGEKLLTQVKPFSRSRDEGGTWVHVTFVSPAEPSHTKVPIAASCVQQTSGDIKLGHNDEWNCGMCLDYPRFLMYNWIIFVSVFQALWFLASVFNYSAPSCPCALLCCSLAFRETTEVWLLNKVAYKREGMLFILPLNNLNGALFFNQCLIVQ